jgi:hypothetical protein
LILRGGHVADALLLLPTDENQPPRLTVCAHFASVSGDLSVALGSARALDRLL